MYIVLVCKECSKEWPVNEALRERLRMNIPLDNCTCGADATESMIKKEII